MYKYFRNIICVLLVIGFAFDLHTLAHSSDVVSVVRGGFSSILDLAFIIWIAETIKPIKKVKRYIDNHNTAPFV